MSQATTRRGCTENYVSNRAGRIGMVRTPRFGTVAGWGGSQGGGCPGQVMFWSPLGTHSVPGQMMLTRIPGDQATSHNHVELSRGILAPWYVRSVAITPYPVARMERGGIGGWPCNAAQSPDFGLRPVSGLSARLAWNRARIGLSPITECDGVWNFRVGAKRFFLFQPERKR